MNKPFDKPISQWALNLVGKTRSNTFAWRGQFSPELIENLLDAYCPDESVVLDPFCGSGTVLCEAGFYGLEAIGLELNPAAYIFSKTYQLINTCPVEVNCILDSFLSKVREIFPEPGIFRGNTDQSLTHAEFVHGISKLRNITSNKEALLLDAFVILLDVHRNEINSINLYSTLYKLISIVRKFPHSNKRVTVILGDSRQTPLDDNSVDFVITSPPYINVFNYHQNYRRSAELLGWDLLKIAKSEIGSNRANRGNRFLTVIQYCLDMSTTLRELHRVTNSNARMIFVVGHESRVLSVPFYNADIISMLVSKSDLFKLVLRQNRTFKNKFGKLIREDILHFEKKDVWISPEQLDFTARNVASDVLRDGLSKVLPKNSEALEQAIESIAMISGIPLYHPRGVQYYKNGEERIARRV